MVRVEQPATQTMPVNARTKRVGFIGKSPLGSNALPVGVRARPRPGRARSRKGVGTRFEAAQVVRDERLVGARFVQPMRVLQRCGHVGQAARPVLALTTVFRSRSPLLSSGVPSSD